jgi:hypothetical protein
VAHIYNPSYSGGRVQVIAVWSQPRANETLSWKKKVHHKVLMEWLKQ